MLATLLLMAAQAFSDYASCTVQGYIFGAGGEVGFTQENCQESVRSTQDGDSVVLYTKRIWVRIKYPLLGGNQHLYYRWTNDSFYIDGVRHGIEWGYVGAG